MKRKLYLKSYKKKKINKLNFILVIIILLVVGVSYILSYINKKISPKLTSYAEIELKKISSIIVNNAVFKYTDNGINIDELYIITRNNKDEILTIDYNPLILNKLLTNITNDIQLTLKNLEEGYIDDSLVNSGLSISKDKQKKNGFIVEIALNQVFNNFLFNNLGPKIPIRLKMLGQIESNIKTSVTNYGINNALVEVYLNIRVNEKVILPVSSSDVCVETSIPISIKILKGSVPSFYNGSINKQWDNSG